jgi:hypothetical protein
MAIYGQPEGPDGYEAFLGFAYWMPESKPFMTAEGRAKRTPWFGGYKVHVSVDLRDAERVAQRLLPILQKRRVFHKVVYPLDKYREMNETKQRGKFITIYPGPILHSFTALVNDISPILDEMKARPGPPTLAREGGNKQAEHRIGQSGIYYVTVRDYSV